jgi:isopentenyl-diphosphate Delta-isomerase
MQVIVVDEQDRVLGAKDRNNRSPSDIIRISALWLFNSQNEVLIAQRSQAKLNDPGKWGASVVGTNEVGETYLSNILKEAREELGISLKAENLSSGQPHLVSAGVKLFVTLFFAKFNLLIADFIIQKEEVEQVRWISLPDLKTLFDNHPENFTRTFKNSLSDLQIFFKTLQ